MGQTFELNGPAVERINGTGTGAEASLLAAYLPELDQMRATIMSFRDMDPSDIHAEISGRSGRLAEMRAILQRNNSQRCTALRTREVDPLREELDLQFRVWSRKIALMEWELKLSGGGI
jgi:hypothetical protein